MEKLNLAVGRYVQFLRDSYRIGRIMKIKGNNLTVILAPYMTRGKNKGVRKRIQKEEIVGIVWRRKVIPWKPIQ